MSLPLNTLRLLIAFSVLSVCGCLSPRQIAREAKPIAVLTSPALVDALPTTESSRIGGQTSAAAKAPVKLVAFERSLQDDQLGRSEAGRVDASDAAVSSTDTAVGSATPLATSMPMPVDAGAMSLADFESIALANNPTLRGLAATTQKAAGYRNQVGLRPNPVAGYQGVQLADKSTDQHTAFVEQEFVTAGKLQLNRAVLNQAVRAQLFELETQRLRVMTDIRAKFYGALAAQQSVALIHEFQSVTDKGLELADLRKKALEGSQIDVLQAKVQKNEIDLAYRQAQVAYAAAWKELVALAGGTQLTPTPLTGELPRSAELLDWAAVAAGILNASPERQAAQTRMVQARANLTRQEVQAIPNLTMQVAGGVDNGTNSGMMNVQIGAPIPVFNQNQGNIAAARAEYCRAAMDVARIENSIKARVAMVSNDYDSALAAVASYSQEILPSAAESLSLAELAYKAGETNFIQVLVARRTYFDSNLQYIRAQSQLAQALAMVDGYVLTGGLDAMNDQSGDDSLRGMTFSQQ